jgi:hypothetical protein
MGVVTVIGAPRVVSFADATGLMSTWLAGTPVCLQQSPAVSLGAITNFGTASSPSLQTCTATGFLIDFMGRPIAGVPASLPTINRSLLASGAVMTTFGAATIISPVATSVTGSLFSSVGTPTHALGQRASGIEPLAMFGSGTTRLSGRHVGNKFTLLGTPTSARIQTAASTYRATRWGTPAAVRSDTYLARGLYNPARFARPTAMRLNGFAASGATSTQFGTPACYLRYRALHTAPACRFGKPLMLWGTPC